MADHTEISWTNATWNPIAGCSIKSPGCRECFAMRRVAPRLAANPATPHYAGTVEKAKTGYVWTGKIGIAPDKAFLKPLTWRKPRMIFVNSTSDLFHEDVPDHVIDRVFAIMALCPQHSFQVLTKRSNRMRRYFANEATRGRIARSAVDMWIAGKVDAAAIIMAGEAWPVASIGADGVTMRSWPLPNVWLGVSVEDQARADERIPDLLATPAAVRFISAEPLLGPVSLRCIPWTASDRGFVDALSGETQHRETRAICPERYPAVAGLDWVIVGGESGPNARPMHPAWARDLRDQCAAAGVPLHFKQWGEWSPVTIEEDEDGEFGAAYPMEGCCATPGAHNASQECLFWQGERLVHWPHIETQSAIGVRRVGKKAAGRLLDGRTHDEFPRQMRRVA